jgi:hypothetical protein
MRIVVDTNVFVGACIGVGACNAVVRACLLHQFVPLTGAPLLTEYEAVLNRTDLFDNSRLDARERDALLDVLSSNASGHGFTTCGGQTCPTSQTTIDVCAKHGVDSDLFDGVFKLLIDISPNQVAKLPLDMFLDF